MYFTLSLSRSRMSPCVVVLFALPLWASVWEHGPCLCTTSSEDLLFGPEEELVVSNH
ncbi:hypothetical protein Fmac_027090 [Flemingia macrophylla]|uniref:Uncharacterized protein n=1 Tax=Flemingia macrophylla TaxID=520843 RepID=A0ABD1LGV1_9FABA